MNIGNVGPDITREHPEYAAKRTMWRQYRDLYAGGEQFIASANQYLVRRQKEPGDVYLERLSRSFYENYVGSIVDWYTATLFRREPVLSFEGNSDRSKKFFSLFTEDCDLKGTNLTEFFRKQFVEALVCGKSYVLVDFPRLSQPVGTRAEEDERGASRGYLVGYAADELINWSYDEYGQYQWVVLRTQSLRKEKLEDAGWVETDALGLLRQGKLSNLRASRGSGQSGKRRSGRRQGVTAWRSNRECRWWNCGYRKGYGY